MPTTLKLVFGSIAKRHTLDDTDGDVTISYEAFKSLVTESYPRLFGATFSVYYTDDEDDIVVVSSEAELAEALRFARAQALPSLRLTISAKEVRPPSPVDRAVPKAAAPEPAAPAPVATAAPPAPVPAAVPAVPLVQPKTAPTAPAASAPATATATAEPAPSAAFNRIASMFGLDADVARSALGPQHAAFAEQLLHGALPRHGGASASAAAASPPDLSGLLSGLFGGGGAGPSGPAAAAPGAATGANPIASLLSALGGGAPRGATGPNPLAALFGAPPQPRSPAGAGTDPKRVGAFFESLLSGCCDATRASATGPATAGAGAGAGAGVAESKTQPEPAAAAPATVAHRRITCDGCGAHPLVGVRHKSVSHPDFDLCAACRATGAFDEAHDFVTIAAPGADAVASDGRAAHMGIVCDGCNAAPILGTRYKSVTASDFDLCASCEATGRWDADHVFLKIRHPKQAPAAVVAVINGRTAETDSDWRRHDVPRGLCRMFQHMRRARAGCSGPASAAATTQSPRCGAWGRCNASGKCKGKGKGNTPGCPARFGRRRACFTGRRAAAAEEGVAAATAASTASAAAREDEDLERALAASLQEVTAPPTTADAPATATATAAPVAAVAAAAAPRHHAVFRNHVTLPSKSAVSAGATVTKTWRMANEGDAPWPAGTTLRHVGGADLGAPTEGVPVPELEVGKTVDVSVPLTVPADAQPGRAVSYFRMTLPGGPSFGHRVWADITVVEPEAPPADAEDETKASAADAASSSASSVGVPADADDVIPVATTVVSGDAPTAAATGNVGALVSMGFAADVASLALERTNGDLSAALSLLVDDN